MRRPKKLVGAGVLLTLASVLTAGQLSCQNNKSNCECNDYNQQVVEKVVGANVVVFYDGLPLGSGIAYRKNGKLYVLTASHIIEDETQTKSSWKFCPKNFVEIDQTESIYIPDEIKQEKTWGTKEIKVTLFNGVFESPISHESCKLVFNNTDYDLAILEVENKSPTTELVQGCVFNFEKPKMGIPVYIMGNPSGDYMSITKGIIGNNNRSRGSLSNHVPFFYQTDADGAPGSSGGGLYRADTGECIGIVVMLNCRNMQIYCVPVQFLKETLIQHNQLELIPSSA